MTYEKVAKVHRALLRDIIDSAFIGRIINDIWRDRVVTYILADIEVNFYDINDIMITEIHTNAFNTKVQLKIVRYSDRTNVVYTIVIE